jgi:hypothetical protein
VKFYLHSRLLERACKVIADDGIAKNMNDLPDSLKPIEEVHFNPHSDISQQM